MPNPKKDQLSSDSLTKLATEAFLPSFLLIVTKVVGMFVLPYLLKYNYQIEWHLDAFPINFVFNSAEEATIVNSYTNLAMFGVIFIGFFLVLIRSYHFHDTHIKPTTTAKLAELKMLHLITTSFDVYHSSFVWFCFMWLSVVMITIYYLFALSFQWVFIVSFLASVLMTYLLIDDLEKEFYVWRLYDEGN